MISRFLLLSRLSPRPDLDIDSRVTWTTRGYHMTRWSLCVLSTTVYSPVLPLYTANLISPISTALRRPHDAIYTGRPAPSPAILTSIHTYTLGGLPFVPVATATVISREVVHDDLEGSNISYGGWCTCGEVVRKVTMFPCNSSLLFS